MFLAFHLSDIVTVPFGWLLSVLYHLTVHPLIVGRCSRIKHIFCFWQSVVLKYRLNMTSCEMHPVCLGFVGSVIVIVLYFIGTIQNHIPLGYNLFLAIKEKVPLALCYV